MRALDTLAVVIPAYNAADTLPDCLAALARSHRRPDEIILFDDGSTDDTARIASEAGVRVVSNGFSKQGPAAGRNAGAEATSASTIIFVDADVVVWPEALGRLEAPIVAGQAVASFGSYDNRPRSRKLAALYANLRHHWVHQHGQRDAFTFWSGLGAVRCDIFRKHKGFDPAFGKPSIEDVELGLRIIADGGRIRLVKDALGTHYKAWGLIQLWRTDIFGRAIPWARLIQEGRGLSNDLNLSQSERRSAVVAHLVWIAIVATLVAPRLWFAPVIAIAVYLFLNRRFFAFLFRVGGLRAGLAGILLHWCYHLYASVTFAVVAMGLPALRAARRFALR